MVRASGSPVQNSGSRSWNAQQGVPGACGVRRTEVLEDEARRELQEDTRAGITGRGRNGRRNRGLELEVREEL